MLLKLLNAQRLRDFFPKATYERGYFYYRQKQVKNVTYTVLAEGERVSGNIVTPAQMTYTPSVLISDIHGRLKIDGTCTCSEPVNCKHVVALLFEALAQNDSFKSSPVEQQMPAKMLRDLLPTSTATESAQDQKVADWLKRLEARMAYSKVEQNKKESASLYPYVKPQPCLYLFQAPILMSSAFEREKPETSINVPLARLSFDYQGLQVAWDDPEMVMSFPQENKLMQFTRDAQIEQEALKLLEQNHFALVDYLKDLKRSYKGEDLSSCFVIGYDTDPLDFMFDVLPILRKKGWQIDIAADYPYRIVEELIDDWYSDIDETFSYDWFNLELGITVKGEKINLLPILRQLIKEAKGKNFEKDAPATIRVSLPTGEFVALPTERVRHIFNVFLELYEADGNNLRLPKMHAARLLELEAAIGAEKLRWFGGAKIRELGRRLTTFSGIKSVALPKEFNGELRGYQQEGLNWLQFLREYNLGGILADDMGLGKTIQALSHLVVEKSAGRMTLPSLIVAPTSLTFNWRSETERFAPHLKILVLHGTQRKQHYHTIADYDVIITTYPLLGHDKAILLQQEFYFLILDEAQFIKNRKSLSTQVVQQIRAKHRLCLTGTPLENHLGELWSLFNFMMPGFLGEQAIFNRLFRNPIEKQGDQERREHLTNRIAPFLLRRTKNKVVKELPEKVLITRQVELEGAQRDLYETIRITMQKKVNDEIVKLGLARSHIVILDALLKLRQICCDPRLLKVDAAQKSNAGSVKLELLMTLLPELLEEGRRILLFSQFTEMLSLIEAELIQQNIPYVKLTGQTKDRETPVKQFQQGEVPLFLISLKAGGTGLNLTAADAIIHYDPWWNPAAEDQATDRAHRIGQDKTVFVYKLVTTGTVEEKILQMQQNKRALMEGLFSGQTTSKLNMTDKDLQGLFDPLTEEY